MKTVEIVVDDSDLPQLMKVIEQLGHIQSVTDKKPSEIDEITFVSEASLAEDWESDEDSRYEKYF